MGLTIMYHISSSINKFGNENVVFCFDPTVVIYHLLKQLPGEATVCIHDYAWETHDAFISMREPRASIRVIDCTEEDARRRGPIFQFRFRSGTEQIIRGHAERYLITLKSEKPIPNLIEFRFTEFLKQFQYQPFVVNSNNNENKTDTII